MTNDAIEISRSVVGNLCYSISVLVSMVDVKRLSPADVERLNYVGKLLFDTTEDIKRNDVRPTEQYGEDRGK